MNQASGGSRILGQAAAAAGAFRQDMLNFRYMYPFKLARSISIIVFRTEYESNHEKVRSYELAKRLQQNTMTGRRGSEVLTGSFEF